MSGSAPHPGDVTADPACRIAIVYGAWHREIVMQLVEDARATLIACGVREDRIAVIEAPGTFEVPLLVQRALKECDGAIACGVILQGGTDHARLIAESATQGLMDVALSLGKPVAHALLSVASLDDARRRVTGDHARGAEAARAVLQVLLRKSP